MGESSFWYRPTRVVPDQRPLNGRCCCCCWTLRTSPCQGPNPSVDRRVRWMRRAPCQPGALRTSVSCLPINAALDTRKAGARPTCSLGDIFVFRDPSLSLALGPICGVTILSVYSDTELQTTRNWKNKHQCRAGIGNAESPLPPAKNMPGINTALARPA